MAELDTSVVELTTAATTTAEFNHIADEPPTELGADQLPAFVVHTGLDYISPRPIDPELTLYDGSWQFQVSMLFDWHKLKEEHTRPLGELHRVREKFLLQLKTDVTLPGFKMTSLRYYTSHFGRHKIRVVDMLLQRHIREDYESSTS